MIGIITELSQESTQILFTKRGFICNDCIEPVIYEMAFLKRLTVEIDKRGRGCQTFIPGVAPDLMIEV